MKPLWHLCKTVCLALEVIKIIYEALHFQQEEMTSAFGNRMQWVKPLSTTLWISLSCIFCDLCFRFIGRYISHIK